MSCLQVETSKKATPTPPDGAPTATPTASTPVSQSTPTVITIKTDAAPPPTTTPTPLQPNPSPLRAENDASPELKIIIDSKEEELKEDIKEEGEEDMEMETEKPVVAVEALPPSSLPSLTNMGVLAPVGLPLPPLMEKQRAIVKPQILTHFIDGFYIHEGPEPFPVGSGVIPCT